MKYTPPKDTTKVLIRNVEHGRVIKWNDGFFIVTDGYEKSGCSKTEFLSTCSIGELHNRIIVKLDDGHIYAPMLTTLVEVVE